MAPGWKRERYVTFHLSTSISYSLIGYDLRILQSDREDSVEKFTSLIHRSWEFGPEAPVPDR